ncbi:glycosyl hydrolase [Granulicella sp. S190]|uniref:glycosyl hydrolase n=1 Tax=Granulicella sp. S190 TaxID=1747226 RepID=UPI00131B4B4F|nr:glycosyl hydrolase [Granulicella sp. S190]
MPATNSIRRSARTKARTSLRSTSALALAACLLNPALSIQAQQSTSSANIASDPLASGFLNPPDTAHPRVWWHWMNGNITKDGITQDLDWMHRVGIAGFQNFDAALNTPKVVDQRLIYMQPGWQEVFNYAIQKGDTYGFEMAVAGSPGWSESGGPWVKPEQAMKKVVWSQTTLEGGKPFRGTLPPPPSATGPFGNLAQQDLMGAMGGDQAPPPAKDYGADTVVLAIREPAIERSMTALHPTVTTSSGAPVDNASQLYDEDLNSEVHFLAAKPGETGWLRYEFSEPVAIQSVTYVAGGQRDPLSIFMGETNSGPLLQSSQDGTTFTDVVRLPTSGAVEHTMDFATVTARYFRIAFAEKGPPSNMQGDIDLSDFGGARPSGPLTHSIAEFQLHTGPRIHRFEEKAGFATLPDLYSVATPSVDQSAIVSKSDVIDLTGKMSKDGTLDWTPPAGTWTILRMGYSLTGITNHPAPAEATGPEVDKLNKADVESYINHYLDNYKKATGGNMGSEGHASAASGRKGGLQFVITDSWEAGTENWTNDILAEFQTRRGYDARPWLPTLAGRIVNSSAESDRFLWDYRRTLEELLVENHYGVIADALHQRGMGQYGESHESGRATIGDGMEMKRYDDVPMAAMWTQRPGVNEDKPGYNADIRESASVAHIYGHPYVAAESMTAAAAPWGWSPATLKPTADKELAMGLNRFVIHSSVHQPLTGPNGADAGSPAPGLTLGPFGQWFNRNEAWAEQAGPWINYLARSSYMLQQGRFVADVAYFYGEGSNITAIFGEHNPPVPSGYNFDYVNADILAHKLRTDHGALITDSGMHYRVLALDPYAQHMSLPVLRRISELVHQGATVVGNAPTSDISLADDQAAFTKLVQELWGTGVEPNRKVGKGRVLSGNNLEAAFRLIDLAPDTTYTKTSPDTEVIFVHRTAPGTDIYFVDNRSDHPLDTETSFRITGRTAELFHADTGVISPASFQSANGRSTVPLHLEPWGTVFVVFRHPTKQTNHILPKVTETDLATVTGPWDVHFEESRGEPETLHLDQLASWSDNSDLGVRYFSGHATYSKHIEASADWFKSGAPLMLDLGDVANLAEVSVNGKKLGTVWKAPYRLDITSALKPGDNLIEARVVNLWVNRLIGDAQPGAPKKYTFTARNPYKANSPLLPAGLLGPVRLISEETAR